MALFISTNGIVSAFIPPHLDVWHRCGTNEKMTASKARVLVTLQQGILDVQGQTVKASLKSLGFTDIATVRVGKIIEIEMQEPLTSDKLQQIEKMAHELLANPVMEDFKVEVL